MKRHLLVLGLMLPVALIAQKVELLPYADFEQWVVRYIKQSKILGGNTVTLYTIAPTDTIRTNKPFIYGQNGNVWATSNAYAKVSGVETGSGTVRPEYRDKENGYCCRLDSKLEVIKAIGIINIRIMVAGSVYTGRMIEPVKSQDDPYQNIDFGVKYTERPSYLQFDYKAKISPEHTIYNNKNKIVEGHDEAQAIIIIQRRWEDNKGNIFAERVATGYERFDKNQPDWVNAHRIRLFYGDMTSQPLYKRYTQNLMLKTNGIRAMNSQGNIVPIQEVGWAASDAVPTHMLVQISSGCYDAYWGHDGNSFWIDNVSLVFE